MMPRVSRPQSRDAGNEFLPLDKCEVTVTTERAIMVTFEVASKTGHTTEMELWVPRSVCEDGDGLSEGDTDIRVKRWFVEKNELPV